MDKGGNINTVYKFWFQQYIKGEKFENSLLPVGLVNSVELFWGFYQHMKRPSELPQNSYIYFFKEGITPVWEDPKNKNGGAFILRFQKQKCDRIWQDVLLSLIGSQKQTINNINGVRVKVRKDNTVEIDVWVSDVYKQQILQGQREWILKATGLQEDTTLQVISFSN